MKKHSSDLEEASVDMPVKKESIKNEIGEFEANNDVNDLETKLEPLTPIMTVKSENVPDNDCKLSTEEGEQILKIISHSMNQKNIVKFTYGQAREWDPYLIVKDQPSNNIKDEKIEPCYEYFEDRTGKKKGPWRC